MTLVTEKTEKNVTLCKDCVSNEVCTIKDGVAEGYVVNYCTFNTTEEDLKKWDEEEV